MENNHDDSPLHIMKINGEVKKKGIVGYVPSDTSMTTLNEILSDINNEYAGRTLFICCTEQGLKDNKKRIGILADKCADNDLRLAIVISKTNSVVDIDQAVFDQVIQRTMSVPVIEEYTIDRIPEVYCNTKDLNHTNQTWKQKKLFTPVTQTNSFNINKSKSKRKKNGKRR